MKFKPIPGEPENTAPKPKRFHTKPVTKPPRHSCNTTTLTPLNTTSTTLVTLPTNDVDTDLRDLSWLPTALSPRENKDNELSTPILDATPYRIPGTS